MFADTCVLFAVYGVVFVVPCVFGACCLSVVCLITLCCSLFVVFV